MSRQLHKAVDAWENEGGKLLPSSDDESWGLLQFLTGTYVVDGLAYATLSDAASRTNALHAGTP